MISTAFRFVYLHVPKTGGNSVQTALLPHSDDTQVIKPGQDGQDRFGITGPVTPRKHARLTEYEARAPGISATHRVVISVRHPFDRALSAYFSPHRWAGGQQTPHWDEAAFEALLERPDLTPACDFLYLPDGGWRRPDLVIRFERLATDFARAVHVLGLPPELARALPHLNRSAGGDGLRARIAGSAELARRVEDRYARDMTAFGYETLSAAG